MNEEQKQTLGQIKATIDEWRKNKQTPAEKMPDYIWEEILNFIETTKCPDNEVIKEIGVRLEQLNNKRKSLGLVQVSQPQKSSSTNSLKLNGGSELTQFEITRPDGLTVKFQAPLSELKNILI